MFSAATMLVMYCGIQTWTEVLRVAKDPYVDWTECDELGHHGLLLELVGPVGCL